MEYQKLTPKCKGTRKFIRKISVRQLKVAILVTAASCFVLLFTYYWYRSSDSPLKKYALGEDDEGGDSDHSYFGSPFRHMPLDELYDEVKEKPFDLNLENEIRERIYMIDTPGCQIPFAWVDYSKDLNKTKRLRNCGKRAVFLKKVGPNKVRVQIQTKSLRTYLRKSKQFECCYRFIDRSKHPGLEDTNIQYSKCKKIKDGSIITLQSDFINIKCSKYNKHHVTHTVYDDVYGFVNKVNKTKTINCQIKYNVLMLGIDSMSMPRFQQMMPRTHNFFATNKWYDFRGFQKVGDNTFPNLMATLTGKNLSEVTKSCANGMDFCNDLMLWSLYNNSGYVTAYGEDYLRLPDTFTKNKGFTNPPTHHYMRPLFLHGETEYNNKSLVCNGKIPSAQQLLNYAIDFVETYKSDNFFGVFWMNSFSHNINSRPQDADLIIENFLNQLTYTGVLDKTFVVILSDHGIRFGESRFQIQSYYDERLPFLYAWLPYIYRYKYPGSSKSFWRNGIRFITPYDLYNTLVDVNYISTCNDNSADISEGCPNCQSLLRLVNNTRECKDVAVDEKWCSCHKLFPLIANDFEGTRSTLFAVSYLQNMTKYIKTRTCWECVKISLKNVIRIHFRYEHGKSALYYVVAFTMAPGDMSYEAVVQSGAGNTSTLVGSISVISPYRNLGKCTIQLKDRLFCVCQKTKNCQVT